MEEDLLPIRKVWKKKKKKREKLDFCFIDILANILDWDYIRIRPMYLFTSQMLYMYASLIYLSWPSISYDRIM